MNPNQPHHPGPDFLPPESTPPTEETSDHHAPTDPDNVPEPDKKGKLLTRRGLLGLIAIGGTMLATSSVIGYNSLAKPDNNPGDAPTAARSQTPGETASKNPSVLEIPRDKLDELHRTGREGAKQDIAAMEKVTNGTLGFDQVTEQGGILLYEYTSPKDGTKYSLTVSRVSSTGGNEVSVYTSTTKANGVEKTGTHVVLTNPDQSASTSKILDDSSNTTVKEIGYKAENDDGTGIRKESATIYDVSGNTVKGKVGTARGYDPEITRQILDPEEATDIIDTLPYLRLTPS